jgi:hypothetical protein
MWWIIAAALVLSFAASVWLLGLWALAGWAVLVLLARRVAAGPAVKDIEDQIVTGC